jgi:murein DD-endopeptidase MepM/ murein hydrolase activator NlpD
MSLLRPVKGPITQDFDGAFSAERPGYLKAGNPASGKRSKIPGSVYRHDLHLGIDYACPEGSPLVAVDGGTVVAQGKDPWSGNAWFVQLRIRRTASYDLHVLYYHLQAGSPKFKVGDKVRAGQVIALSGNTGWSTNPHLHFCLVRMPRGTLPGKWFENLFYDPQPFIDGMDLSKIAP